MKYIIGLTTYDDWDELFGTKIGLDKSMQQCYTVWGVTEQESRKLAYAFKDFLNETLQKDLKNMA